MKVFLEKPNIIVVCTQDSASKRTSHSVYATHYQHVLGELLKNNGYALIKKHDASNTKKPRSTGILRGVASRTILFDKGIRTRVYCKSIDTPPQVEMKQLDLGTFTDYSLYNGAILTKIQLPNYNIAVVNCNLYYQREGNTGLAKRIEEFNRIVDGFKLGELNTTNRYNIFFCGDLNFRSFTKKNTNQTTEYDIHNLIIGYVSKTNTIPRVFPLNEIHKALPIKETNSIEKQDLFKRLLKSYRCFGTQLTYKYKKGQFENELKLMNNGKLPTNYKQILNIKPNGYFRIPSQSCRILLAKFRYFNCIKSKVNAHFFPDKSDHKMLSLACNFYELDNIDGSVSGSVEESKDDEGIEKYNYDYYNIPKYRTI
jgi:hypothetical protein